MLAKQDLDFLRGLSVFAGLRDDVIETIGRLGRRVEVAAGEKLFGEGEPANEMVVVLDGRLDIIKRGDHGGEACIATLGPGAVAGEMSLIDIQPRSADVHSVVPTSLVVLSHGDLAKVYGEDTESHTLLLMNIAREISLRLRRLDAMLANTMIEIQRATSSGEGERP